MLTLFPAMVLVLATLGLVTSKFLAEKRRFAIAGSAAGTGIFRDDDSSVHESDIEQLAAAGITRGCNPPANDLFCPEDPVTRAQMAAFLHRALEDTLTPGAATQFTDDNGSIFESDIEWLAAAGIIAAGLIYLVLMMNQ